MKRQKLEMGSDSQGMPRAASSHQKLGEAWNRFSLRASRRKQSY